MIVLFLQILQANVECLAAVVNTATFNFKIVRDIYEKFWQTMVRIQSIRASMTDQQRAGLLRALCIVSLLIQHFDLDSEAFGYLSPVTDRLIENLLNLLKQGEWPANVQQQALKSLGNFPAKFSVRSENYLPVIKIKFNNVESEKIVGNLFAPFKAY